ncbi:armadillo-type protein [Multifurca ochricompacta]|uniref:Armadillo-type protein n=1 Tax=Multifurca ochricompacta TaxID=376703 RepID=A0AAD4QIW2_9AGAM|nr:armadillo-type protein [Multifurca ochricompacta]
MSDIPKLLLYSLNPQSRKQAEQSLEAYSRQPAFVIHLLQLVLDVTQDNAVRLAASVYLKNTVKLGWLEDDEHPISLADKEAIKPRLVPAMIALSNANEKAIRAQIAESVSLIAELDFPEKWPDLIDQLIQSLSSSDFHTNLGVLETAHSIFRSWRSQARSDEFWSIIKLVHSKFLDPYFELFKFTIARLLNSPDPLLAQTMAVLIELFYDLTCQDLAPAFEDGHEIFFGAQTGYFMQLMAWDPPELHTDPDEPTPSIPSKIRTGILEIAELYVKLYPEMLGRSQSVAAFVGAVWKLVGGGKQLGIAYDQLVSQSLRFISTAIRAGAYRDIFESRDTIQGLIAGVVVPNLPLRTRDVEAFEDTPLEYVRGELQVSEISTPRQAAADVVKALVGVGPDSEIATTTLALEWISRALSEAAQGGEDGWKSKDAAVYLFEAVATRSGTLTQGVTATNPNVNVVQWFADNIFGDLQAGAGNVNPVLQVDAIRYLFTFRNQLTKGQLVSVLPLLLNRLESKDVVVYTYATVALDRILSMRVGDSTTLLFTSADVQPFSHPLLKVLLDKIEAQTSPERVAENDFLMRCVARVIITAKQGLGQGYVDILRRLVSILSVIARNPSNPNFDQYFFESISGLIRFIGPAVPDSIAIFEPALFPPFTEILQKDIDQYIPYVFQILAQMLKLHRGVPVDYRSLLPFLVTPAIWAQKGSIPGLVALLRAFLARDAAAMVGANQHTSVLGIVQQRLIPSKANDGWGFELLQSIVLHVPLTALQPYFRQIILALLTRMQQNKTNIYIYYFVYFLLYVVAINVDGLTPDYLIQTVDEIQPGLWSQIVSNFVVPQAAQLAVKDRKVAAVGLTRLLTQSTLSLRKPNVERWPALLGQLAELFREPKAFASAEDAGTGMTEVDLEEQAAGYQASYSKLATAAEPPPNLVAYAGDVRTYVLGELKRLLSTEPGVKDFIKQASQDQVGPFLLGLGISI